jgi:tetratricopeptide (TPR) repeat protein
MRVDITNCPHSRYEYGESDILVKFALLYALRHIFYLMPIIRQMLGNWTEVEANVWFLAGDLVAIVLLYTWFNRVPTAGSGFRTIWRYGRELLTFAYLWSAGCLLWLNWAALFNADHRHFVAVVVLLALDGLVIAYLLGSSQVKAVFASFPPPDQADELKRLATESANAKRQLIAAAKLAVPIAKEGTPESVRENELRALVDVEPSDAMAWFELGVLAYQHQKSEQAQAFMNKALSCDAQNAIILRSLCELNRQQGRVSDAVRYGLQAVKFAQEDEIAHLNLALALTDKKDFDAAITHYHRVLDSNPQNLQAWLNMAVLLAQQKRRDDALAALEAVMLIEPENPHATSLKSQLQ